MIVLGALFVWITYALAIGGGIAFCVALARRKINSGYGLLWMLIYVPILLLAISFWRAERRGTEWRDMGNFTSVTREAVMEYYHLYPERFTRIGNDEELHIDGFIEWLPSFLKDRKANWPEVIRQFHYRNNQLITPEGQTVRFAMDFDKDMYVTALQQRILIAEPGSITAATYKTAIGIQFRSQDPIFCEAIY